METSPSRRYNAFVIRSCSPVEAGNPTDRSERQIAVFHLQSGSAIRVASPSAAIDWIQHRTLAPRTETRKEGPADSTIVELPAF